MKIQKAIEILELHNLWRRDNDNKYEMANPKELGIAIDTVLSEVKKTNIVGSFSSREELEHHISVNMPLAMGAVKKGKKSLLSPFSSNKAREIVINEVVECLLKK